MRKLLLTVICIVAACNLAICQSKTIIGIVPFRSAEQKTNYYNRQSNTTEWITAIQDAVTEAFLGTKRFALVEREKMDQINGEKNLQKGEDFIDGQVIEQSKSLGAQYIVMGNVTKAELVTSQTTAPFAGTITSRTGEIAFSIKVVDVTTGLIAATQSFSGSGRGKNAIENALEKIKPDIEQFVRENFKVIVSVASVEEKNSQGDAVKVLISGGSSLGMKPGDVLKVYEQSELMVDGKKLARKVTLGKITVAKVEDENFSVCGVTEGGADIAKKVAAGAKVKCEIIQE